MNHQINCPLSPQYQGGWGGSVSPSCSCGLMNNQKTCCVSCSWHPAGSGGGWPGCFMCPCHTAESHYLNSLTPEEQKKQDELQASAVLTTTDTAEKKCPNNHNCLPYKSIDCICDCDVCNPSTTDTAESHYDKQNRIIDKNAEAFWEAPTTDTSDWRERLGGFLNNCSDYDGYKFSVEDLEAFIATEIERAKADGRAEEAINCHEHVERARASTLEEVKALAEGMKRDAFVHNYTHNAALQGFLQALSDKQK